MYYTIISVEYVCEHVIIVFHSICMLNAHYVIFQGWLIDFLNHFGMLGGFKLLQERICDGGSLSVSLLAALIR
jgi:hypothetical protein